MSGLKSLFASQGGKRLGIGVLVGLATLGIGIFLISTIKGGAPQRSGTLQARIELAAGTVKVDSGQGAVPVVSGAPLHIDAQVSAGEGSRALLRLSDGTGMFLRGGTTLKLTKEGTSLEAGQLWMDAAAADRKPAVHRVGEVTVAAAGAGLELTRAGDQVTVYVARGLASVDGPGGRVEVQAGERATVRGKSAPELKPVTFWEDWTGGMADHAAAAGLAGAGAGTLYGVDFGGAPGSAASTLEISHQSIRAVIRDGLAETEVDQTFFNPSSRAVEGWYWFSIPLGAHVTGFALDSNGTLIEGELIERNEARRQYEGAAAAGHEPALLEWVDGHTFRARIYPVPGAGSRRAVLRYLQRLPLVEGRMRFVHPLQSREPLRIGEFSLTVDLGEAGANMELSTLEDARIENGGRHITMRRSGYKPLADFQLEARLKQAVAPVRVSRFTTGGDTADYVMARWVPDVDWNKVEVQKGEVVLVVDTSGAGDESARQLKTATAEAVLRSLSADDRFALVALDVKPTVLHPVEGLAAASEKEITSALERLADRLPGGATDLSAVFDVALARLHGAEQPAVIYVGDGWATSGELSGEALGERLRRALSTSRARFFTVAVGADANQPLLAELARSGGGRAFAVDDTEQAMERSLQIAAAVKTPTLTDLEIDLGAGLDETFLTANGKVSRGEEVILLARTHHDLPPVAKIRGRLGGQPFSRDYSPSFETTVATARVPRRGAVEAIQRLLGTAAEPDAIRGKIVAMGMEYGLMTPYTSFIALESEQAFQQRGIQRRRSRLQGVRLSALTANEEREVLASLGALPMGVLAFGCLGKDAPSAAMEAPAAPAPVTASRKAMADFAPAASAPRGEHDYDRMMAAPSKPSEMKRAMPMPPAAMMLGALSEMKEEGGRGGSKMAGSAGGLGMAGVNERPKLAHANPVEAVRSSLCAAAKVRNPCSDLSRRPLAERAIIWTKRLKAAESAPELVERFQAARAACELNDWRAESRFLQLMQRYVRTPDDATYVVGQFACQGESRMYLARLLLRRAVDEAFIAAVQSALFESPVEWAQADLELSAIADPAKRLERLRGFVARAPDDANGTIRLCRALVKVGATEEALLHARRLHERGLMTPLLLREVGDLLTQQGQSDEAVRTYSEIVEFDSSSLGSRRLLGDIYLGRGWYDAAYRQYRTLTELQPNDFSGWLRLASAAAGSGRLDEALRLERKVAGAEGTPGPDDPRRWARLKSAARLAQAIQSPPKGEGEPAKIAEAMKRKLKELQLFQGPGSLVLVTWDDLAVELALSPAEVATARGEVVDAATVGLSGALLPTGGSGALHPLIKVRGGHRSGPVKLLRHDVEWDGKDFKIGVREMELAAGADSVML
ncbi:MAG: VWA domain-containing protein [Deltaproteobacteria bacterium]|nr:VWA domain-containing protein [Deltaproteobacteria bacterium]